MPTLDKLKYFPDELTSGCNGECVGFTTSDIIGNRMGYQCDVSFSYALGLWMPNATPTTIGEDPYAAMAAAVVFGALPVTDLSSQELTMSQLEKVNIANYSPAQLQQAALAIQNGVITFNSYAEIEAYLAQNIGGVSLAMKFYQSFLLPNQDGSLSTPSGGYSEHNVGVWASTTQGLLIKPYINPSHSSIPTWGVNGYCYLTEANFNFVAQGAYAFTPDAWRWLSLVRIALQYPARITQILPKLSSQ